MVQGNAREIRQPSLKYQHGCDLNSQYHSPELI
jgi:hypothetical protein